MKIGDNKYILLVIFIYNNNSIVFQNRVCQWLHRQALKVREYFTFYPYFHIECTLDYQG